MIFLIGSVVILEGPTLHHLDQLRLDVRGEGDLDCITNTECCWVVAIVSPSRAFNSWCCISVCSSLSFLVVRWSWRSTQSSIVLSSILVQLTFRNQQVFLPPPLRLFGLGYSRSVRALTTESGPDLSSSLASIL